MGPVFALSIVCFGRRSVFEKKLGQTTLRIEWPLEVFQVVQPYSIYYFENTQYEKHLPLLVSAFLLIPRVCKRWSSFRTENMWKNRLKRDFDLDTKSLRKQPDNTMKLYKKIYSAKRELFRKAHHFGLKPENLVIQMPCKLSRSFSM